MHLQLYQAVSHTYTEEMSTLLLHSKGFRRCPQMPSDPCDRD